MAWMKERNGKGNGKREEEEEESWRKDNERGKTKGAREG
jgi:hypothetical protein